MKEFEIVCPLTRESRLKEIEAKAGGWKWVLKKRSVDARKEPVWRYQYEAYGPGEEYVPYELPEALDVHDAEPVIIVGAGPAGMFAALKLLTLGLKPVILERGKNVHERKFDMAKLSRDGVVDPDSNYCYGEGGAGAFSDGKLYTRSSKRGDLREVLYQLVKFGASKDILIDAHPHIGSDKLPVVVENIRNFIVSHGGEYHFSSRVVSISSADVAEAATASGNRATLGIVRGRGPSPDGRGRAKRDVSGGSCPLRGAETAACPERRTMTITGSAEQSPAESRQSSSLTSPSSSTTWISRRAGPSRSASMVRSAIGESFSSTAGALRSSIGSSVRMSGVQSSSRKTLRPAALRRAGSA